MKTSFWKFTPKFGGILKLVIVNAFCNFGINFRSAVDFAYACSLARPSLKGSADGNCLNKFTPAVTKSLRNGLFAAKTAPLLCSKRRLTNKPLTMKVTKGRVLEARLKTQNEDRSTKGLTCKRKKRKLTRSKHISLLDGQGRQNLLNRCNTILTVEKG